MTLLDISGSGLSSEIFNVLGVIGKLAAGSIAIILLAVFSFIGIIIYSLSKGYQTSSVLGGARTFVHAVAYLIGISTALVFAMVATTFFSLAAFKLLFVSVLIAFTVSFVVRETFLFLILKRFGKYLMYFTALQYIQEKVYTNGQQQNEQQNNF